MDIIPYLIKAFKYGGPVLTVLVTIAGISYFIFYFLGSKMLDHHFSRKLKQFEYEANSLFNRITKIHEKEVEVLPVAWSKLMSAIGKVNYYTETNTYVPRFKDMTDEEVKHEIAEFKLYDFQKEALLNSSNRTEDYIKFKHKYRTDETFKVITDFHNYIGDNSIFLSEDLKRQFTSADKILWDATRIKQLGVDIEDNEEILAAKKILTEIHPITDEIERLVQKRLRFEEAN